MKEPIKLTIHVMVEDGEGEQMVDDTFIRENLSYAALVTFQRSMGATAAALQAEAEAKAAKGNKG